MALRIPLTAPVEPGRSDTSDGESRPCFEVDNETVRSSQGENSVFCRLAQVQDDPGFATLSPYADIFDRRRSLHGRCEQRKKRHQNQALTVHRGKSGSKSRLCRVSIPPDARKSKNFLFKIMKIWVLVNPVN